jgi:hypothetical protein
MIYSDNDNCNWDISFFIRLMKRIILLEVIIIIIVIIELDQLNIIIVSKDVVFNGWFYR